MNTDYFWVYFGLSIYDLWNWSHQITAIRRILNNEEMRRQKKKWKQILLALIVADRITLHDERRFVNATIKRPPIYTALRYLISFIIIFFNIAHSVFDLYRLKDFIICSPFSSNVICDLKFSPNWSDK